MTVSLTAPPPHTPTPPIKAVGLLTTDNGSTFLLLQTVVAVIKAALVMASDVDSGGHTIIKGQARVRGDTSVCHWLTGPTMGAMTDSSAPLHVLSARAPQAHRRSDRNCQNSRPPQPPFFSSLPPCVISFLPLEELTEVNSKEAGGTQ